MLSSHDQGGCDVGCQVFWGDGNVVEKEGFGKVVAMAVLETQRPGWMCICKAVKIKL